MSQTYLDPAASRRKKRRRALLAVLLSASILTLGSGAFSLAQFTDTESTDGTWSAGTIILGVSPSPTFTVDDILPGQSGTQDITVSNAGTGDLRYAMAAAAIADPTAMSNQLTLTVNAGTCLAPGAELYTGAMNGASFGDPTQGDDPGDRVVAATGTDALCFSWSFPLAAGNGYQGASATVQFTFNAEQTDYNP
jgi:hypothetical protein